MKLEVRRSELREELARVDLDIEDCKEVIEAVDRGAASPRTYSIVDLTDRILNELYAKGAAFKQDRFAGKTHIIRSETGRHLDDMDLLTRASPEVLQLLAFRLIDAKTNERLTLAQLRKCIHDGARKPLRKGEQ